MRTSYNGLFIYLFIFSFKLLELLKKKKISWCVVQKEVPIFFFSLVTFFMDIHKKIIEKRAL